MAYSYNQYVGNGVITDFSITFGYLATAHVSVLVDNVAVSFTWVTPAVVRVSPAPAFGTLVKVQRTTPRTVRVVDFTDASTLNEMQLDNSALQMMYLAQEAMDLSVSSLNRDFFTNYDAQGHRIVNLGDPVDAQDAVPKSWIEPYVVAAQLAQSQAETAMTAAQLAETLTYAKYDEFDARYLGPKTTAPSLDNQGNALLVGSLYWDITDGALRVWNGAAWETVPTVNLYTPTEVDARLAAAARGNILINGSFRVWQRKLSFSSPTNGSYTADRWVVIKDGSVGLDTIQRATVAAGSAAAYPGMGSPEWRLNWAIALKGTGQTVSILQQRVENLREYAGQRIKVGGWFRSTSATADAVEITGTVYYGSGGTPSSTVYISSPEGVQAIPSDSAWHYLEATLDVPADTLKTYGTDGNSYLGINFSFNENAIRAMSVSMTRVKAEVGPYATAYVERPMEQELALCYRYYQKSYELDTPIQTSLATGYQMATAASAWYMADGTVPFPATMRTSPAVTLYSYQTGVGTLAAEFNASSVFAADRAVGAGPSDKSFRVQGTAGNFNTTAGYTLRFHWVANAEL